MASLRSRDARRTSWGKLTGLDARTEIGCKIQPQSPRHTPLVTLAPADLSRRLAIRMLCRLDRGAAIETTHRSTSRFASIHMSPLNTRVPGLKITAIRVVRDMHTLSLA